MIWIILLLAVFICISSIFFPELRKLAMAILTTAAVVVGGFLMLIEYISEIFHK